MNITDMVGYFFTIYGIVVKAEEMTGDDINERLQEDAQHFLYRAEEILKAIEEEKNGLSEILRSAENLYEIAYSNSSSSKDLSGINKKLIDHTEQLKSQMDIYKL